MISAISFTISLKHGEFKQIKNQISPNLVYFFLTVGLPVIALPIFLIAKKFSVAVELFIPFYALYVTLFLVPTWSKHPLEPHLIQKTSLLQANNFVYILNGLLIFFFSSHYTIALAARSVLTVNNLNMSFRRWLAGDSTLLPVLFNFFTCTILFEGHAYNLNKQKVELFLEKEKIKKQEEQTQKILQHIPTNVLMISGSKVVFKNKYCENLIQSVCNTLPSQERENPEFESTSYFYNQEIFMPFSKEDKTSQLNRLSIHVQQSIPKMSLASIVSRTSSDCSQFEIMLPDQ